MPKLPVPVVVGVKFDDQTRALPANRRRRHVTAPAKADAVGGIGARLVDQQLEVNLMPIGCSCPSRE